MSEPQTPQAPQVQIKADEKELLGQYSNLVMIHHNPEEFTLHFIYLFTNGTHGKLAASMILSPGHAKRLWRAMGDNISRFEAQFGPIREDTDARAAIQRRIRAIRAAAPEPDVRIGYQVLPLYFGTVPAL